jgi:mediator of RNA polymerase II transcription subunit 6
MICIPRMTTAIGSLSGTSGYKFVSTFCTCRIRFDFAVQANGPLTADNVFEYFATSMFYDKQSNNQVLRMQTIHTGMPILNEAEELKYVLQIITAQAVLTCIDCSRRFTGVEFAIVYAQPPSLFIIHKRERLSPDEGQYFILMSTWLAKLILAIVRPLSAYFIMNNRIYQSPDVYTVLSNRLVGCVG